MDTFWQNRHGSLQKVESTLYQNRVEYSLITTGWYKTTRPSGIYSFLRAWSLENSWIKGYYSGSLGVSPRIGLYALPRQFAKG